MMSGRYTAVALAGPLAAVLLVCSLCIIIHSRDWGGARYEKEVELPAPLAAGSSFAAETRDDSIRTTLPIAVEGKIGRALISKVGAGKGRIRLRTNVGSITIR